MNEPNHREYYVQRAAASRDLAQRAVDPSIAAIHKDFAIRHEALVAAFKPPRRGGQAT